MKKKCLSCLLVLLVLAASLFCFFPAIPVRAHNPTWWDFDWDQRLELTVNASLVDGDLIDFPVLVYVGEDTLDWGDVQNSLDDIRFTGDILDELSFEIESFTLNWEAWFWVRLPEVSSSVDTYFFMYFDNKFCESGEDAEAVWDSSFVMVQHMKDETTSTILDSTSYDNDGTKKDANEPIEATGKIGKAQDFEPTDDYVSVADTGVNADMSFSFWVNLDSVTGFHGLLSKYTLPAATNPLFGVFMVGNKLNVEIVDIAEATRYLQIASPTSFVIGTDYFVTVVYDGDADKLYLYVDNVLKASGDWTYGFGANTYPVYIGKFWAGFLDGTIDEVQIAFDAWVPAWVGASYYSETLELVIVGYHYHPPDTALRGEFIAAALVASLILVPLLILIIFAARRKR